MNDKKYAIGRDLNRVPLYTVVPRSVPFAVGIGPCDICNFRCNYCAQSIGTVKDARVLQWDEYLNIIDQIKELIDGTSDRIKIMKFIGNGEPLINPKTPDMVKIAVDNNLADRYELTTNGSLLTHEISDRLLEAGLTRLLISIQGVSEKSYVDVCDYKIDLNELVSQIKYFYQHSRNKCKVFIKTVETALDGQSEVDRFYDIFGPISDEINVENVIPSIDGIDFSNILSDDEMNRSRYNIEDVPKTKEVCDTLFMYLNIHANGDVDPCGCMYPPLFIGNVFKQRLKAIWNGSTHKEIMIKHLTGHKSEIAKCDKCSSINLQGGFKEDYLDPYKEIILKRVEEL